MSDDVEATLSRLERELERTKAVQEIQNVMGRYCYWHTAGMHDECADLFALNTPGVSADIGGVYKGRESVERLYREYHPRTEAIPTRLGRMHMHTLTTPVIEVAEDLRTAKGLWNSPGQNTFPNEGKPPSAFWVWLRYGCDFALENGRWKIWHLSSYRLFSTPFEKSWTEPRTEALMPRQPPLQELFKPDAPSPIDTSWRADRVYTNIPVPRPYKTFDERNSY